MHCFSITILSIRQQIYIIIQRADNAFMKIRTALQVILALVLLSAADSAQQPEPTQEVRTMTIPISIFTKKELREKQAEEYVQADRLIVKEDKDEQQILSIRSVSDA